MYKYGKRDAALINFRQVFANEINVKVISLGLIAIFSIFLIIASCSFIFASYEEGDASSNSRTETPEERNARVNNLSYINTSNQYCSWDCYPKDMSCYRRENPPGSGHYDMFTLVVHTSMGDAIGDATCQDPGLCEPGNYDILHCYERGGTWGVPGDSSGWCTVLYTGYSEGYHHFEVTNDGSKTTENYQRWVGKFKTPAVGYLDMQKWTTWNPSFGSSNYSFKDIKYYIYSSYNDALNRTNPVDAITIDINGYGKTTNGLRADETFYIRESNKPGEHGIGYKVNEEIASVKINHDTTTRIRWSEGATSINDEPILGELPITIAKTDAQTLTPGISEGSVEDLSGALYEFKYRKDRWLGSDTAADDCVTWIMKTDENGQVSISDKYRDNKVDGDDLYEYQGKVVAPLGTYFIKEIQAPEGYLVSPRSYMAILTPDESSPTGVKTVFRDENTGLELEQIKDPQTGKTSVNVLEQVIRGDYKFTKVNDSKETLAGIPFKISSKSTGEWHIAVTDKNGIIDTGAGHYLHSKNTNCNDDLYDLDTGKILNENALTSNCGTWFALNKQSGEIAQPDDNFAALPYDTYLIEEIPISKNEKYLPFETRTFVVENDSYKVEGETWVNMPPKHIQPVLPQTGDFPYGIIALPVLAVLCYITRRWVYYRKY